MTQCRFFDTSDLIEFGLHPLAVMSTNQFKPLREELGFSGPYKAEVKSIARDFTMTALRCLTVKLPGEPRNEVFDEAGLLEIWASTFERLDAISYAEDICRWIMRIKKEKEFASRAEATGWFYIFRDWSMGTQSFPPINLAHETAQAVQILELRYLVREYQQSYRSRNLEKYFELDEWDTFVLKERSNLWINQRGREHNALTKWVSVFRILTSEEIKLLNQWGLEISKTKFINYQYPSLVGFADDLREANYL